MKKALFALSLGACLVGCSSDGSSEAEAGPAAAAKMGSGQKGLGNVRSDGGAQAMPPPSDIQQKL